MIETARTGSRHRTAAILGLMAGLVFCAGCGTSRTRDTASASAGTIDRKAEKGPVKLVVQVSPEKPRLSDLVEMDVRVEAQPEVEIKPPAFGQAVGDFLIRDYSERPPEPGAGNTRRFHYQLEPAHAGKHLIRSVAIEFIDKRPGAEGRGERALIETEPLEVDVTSELEGKAPSLADLEPMLPPQPVPQTFSMGWIIAAVSVPLLAISAVFWLRRRRRQPVEARRRTPEEIAHEALELLLAEDLPARPGQGILSAAHRHRPPVCGRYHGNPGTRADDGGISSRHAVASGLSAGTLGAACRVP